MRKSELKIKLSELAFQVTQNAATEPPFINVYAVTLNYSVPNISSTHQLAGQVFIHALMRR